jgi:RimJ/RimL family protein N-acetyltransferase
MPDDAIIRLLTADDVDEFLRLGKRITLDSGQNGSPIHSAREEWDPAMEDRIRARGGSQWLLPVGQPNWQRSFGLFLKGSLCGDVSLRGGELETEQHRALLSIGLLPEARCQGHGRRMMETAIAWAANQPSLAWIVLAVFVSNHAAHTLYQKMGFVEYGRIPDRFRIHGQSVDDVDMLLDLDAWRQTHPDH